MSLDAEPSALVIGHGHAYVFGGANVDVIALEGPPRRIAQRPSPPAVVSAAIARFDVALSRGAHALEAVSRAAGQPERTSEPVALVVDPSLGLDLLGTTFDDGTGRGPVGVAGQGGCAEAGDGWTLPSE